MLSQTVIGGWKSEFLTLASKCPYVDRKISATNDFEWVHFIQVKKPVRKLYQSRHMWGGLGREQELGAGGWEGSDLRKDPMICSELTLRQWGVGWGRLA